MYDVVEVVVLVDCVVLIEDGCIVLDECIDLLCLCYCGLFVFVWLEEVIFNCVM